MKARKLVWNWRDALFGFVIALPGTILVALGHVEQGLPLFMGALPGAIVGLAPARKQRGRLPVVGLLFSVFLALGAVITQWPVLITMAIMFGLAIGAALLAARKPIGVVALTLCLPLAGIGLSFSEPNKAFSFAGLIIVSSVIAYAVALWFKEYTAPPTASEPPLGPREAPTYGVYLGLAAVAAIAIGHALNVDHVGWATAAALFVMRPGKELLEARGIGRTVSVFSGAIIASWLLTLDLPSLVIAVCAAAALIAAAATRTSWWYITPAFSTFLMFWLTLYGKPGAITHRFDERVIDTLIGVGLAFSFGLVVPFVIERLSAMRARRRSLPPTP